MMCAESQVHETLDVRGEVCPFPWVHAKKALKKLEVGQVLRISGDHGPALKNIPQNFGDDGQTVLSAEATSEVDWEILVRREK
jgi:TusA-related sulfurtransferase